MKAILIDAYRNKDAVVLWLKTPENTRIVRKFVSKVYLEDSNLAREVMYNLRLKGRKVTKRNYGGTFIKVYEVKVNISRYERTVKAIEYESKHRLMMYNADIAPEQMFLYQNGLRPFMAVDAEKLIPLKQDVAVPLEKISIRVDGLEHVTSIAVNGKKITGRENNILEEFSKMFASLDPDVVLMEKAFSRLPFLVSRLDEYKISCPFHRWDPLPIKSKGGKSFFSYGRVIYRDFAIRLRGRFLVDSTSVIGNECNVEAVIELSKLSGTRFQHIASRSFGAVFQSSLVRNLVEKDYLVPFKEKPVDPPVTLFHLLKFDRVGHTFDSITGLHKNVAEIDFSSLFPWIIYNYNISPETLQGEPPYQEIPGLPLKISLRQKGIVPLTIKPLLDRRMHYKRNPSALNNLKAQGLKWVLVTSYGYLRFREFKLGLATTHMAIGAFAREIMIKAKNICEDHGFRIVHGIVDSLYIQKEGISEEEVKEVCKEIELETGLPICFEGLFKWIVFLPSVNDIERPVATRYYGVGKEIKVRGIEMRQKGAPKIVKHFQNKVLQMMSSCDNKEDIQEMFPYFCQVLRKYLFMLPEVEAGMLSCSLTISKTEYEKNIPQKAAVRLLKEKGIPVRAGQKIEYVFSDKGIVLPENYEKPDIEYYKRVLIRALFVVLQPFGITKKEINEYVKYERQTKITEYSKAHLHSFEAELQVPQGAG